MLCKVGDMVPSYPPLVASFLQYRSEQRAVRLRMVRFNQANSHQAREALLGLAQSELPQYENVDMDKPPRSARGAAHGAGALGHTT